MQSHPDDEIFREISVCENDNQLKKINTTSISRTNLNELTICNALAVWKSIIHSKSRHISTLMFIYRFITLVAKHSIKEKKSIELGCRQKKKQKKWLFQSNTSAKFKQAHSRVHLHII